MSWLTWRLRQSRFLLDLTEQKSKALLIKSNYKNISASSLIIVLHVFIAFHISFLSHAKCRKEFYPHYRPMMTVCNCNLESAQFHCLDRFNLIPPTFGTSRWTRTEQRCAKSFVSSEQTTIFAGQRISRYLYVICLDIVCKSGSNDRVLFRILHRVVAMKFSWCDGRIGIRRTIRVSNPVARPRPPQVT